MMSSEVPLQPVAAAPDVAALNAAFCATCAERLDLASDGDAPLVTMAISGHKTDSVLRRYAIISEADQRAALERTQESQQKEMREQEKETARPA